MWQSRTLARRGGAALGWPLVLAALGLATAGCERCAREEPPVAVRPPPPPARPTELAAEFVIADPAAHYRALRLLFGAPASLLPAGPELALSTLLGLDALAAGSFDLSRPVVGGVLFAEAGTADLVTAIPLTHGSEFVARLTSGSAARYRLESKGGASLLIPVESGQRTFAVIGDALLIGQRSGLERAGPYLGRNLLLRPASGPPRLELTPSALSGVVRGAWQQRRRELAALAQQAQRRHGRPADFADPEAVLGAADTWIESLVSRFADANAAQLLLRPGDAHLQLDAQLRFDANQPESGAGVEPKSLAGLPATTRLAFSSRRAAVPAGPPAPAAFLRALFGPRLTPDQASALERVFSGIEASRGDSQQIVWLEDWSLLWAGDVRDAAALKRGFDELFSSIVRSPWVEPLAEFLGRPRLIKERVRVGGSSAVADRFRLFFQPARARATAGTAAARSEPLELEAVVLIEPERFLVGLGRDADPALAAGLAARSGAGTLAAIPAWARALGRVERAASWVLVADAGVLGAGAVAPLVVSGVSSEHAFALRIDSSAAALESLTRWGLLP
jgi:hypothetical protein